VTVVALCSLKQSPGTTTLALALTAALSQRHQAVTMAEADPAGGDLAATIGFPSDPGLVTLAAEARRAGTWPDITGHSVPLASGGSLLAGPDDAGQAAAAIAHLGARLVPALRTASTHSVVDCGRWAPGAPTGEILSGCDQVIIGLHPTVSGVSHLLAAVTVLGPMMDGRISLCLAGSHPYGAAEVSAATGLAVEVVVPDDRRGLQALLDGRPTPRSGLMRAAARLADRMTAPTAVPTAVRS